MQSRHNKVTNEDFLKAANDGELSVVSRYIEENNNSPDAINVTGKDGCTALMYAAANMNKSDDCIKILNTLLKIPGINLEVADTEGNTALMVAVHYRNSESVLTLLEAGADVNAINKNGDTVFILAVKEGGYAVTLRLLLEKNLKLDLYNQGKKALLAAEHSDHRDRPRIYKLLSQHMAALNLAAITAENTADLLASRNIRFFSPLQQQNNVTPDVTRLTISPKP